MGLRRRARSAELERWRGLHDLPALRLRRRPALPHDGWLQPQTEAAAARAAPKEAVQALGSYVAEGDGVGTRGGLEGIHENEQAEADLRGRLGLSC